MKIRTDGLSRTFRIGSNTIKAVDKVNLEIANEKVTAIIGPSGSGKSTLLNLIGLNDIPDSGHIFFDDSDTSQLSGRERRRIRLFRMGFVFQTFNLLPTLNALENVELPMALSGKSAKHQRERAVKLLEIVGLADRLFHRPKQLSLGEMQRVAIARALSNDAELIIADEPTGELDSKTGAEITNLFLDINRSEKKALIIATHDKKVIDVADIVYEMKDGKTTLLKQN